MTPSSRPLRSSFNKLIESGAISQCQLSQFTSRSQNPALPAAKHQRSAENVPANKRRVLPGKWKAGATFSVHRSLIFSAKALAFRFQHAKSGLVYEREKPNMLPYLQIRVPYLQIRAPYLQVSQSVPANKNNVPASKDSVPANKNNVPASKDSVPANK